jgi:hypothetical protein
MANYILPDAVISPKQHWSLIKVLYDGGEGKDDGENYSIALGRWDNQPAIGMRWNGGEGSPIGNPQSRGLPTWFLVPKKYEESILDQVSKDMRTFVTKFFEK